MELIDAINVVRDTLRDNLTDPYVTAGGNSRNGLWIHTDEPNAGATYPRIQIKKFDNPIAPISIGSNFTEEEVLILNIWFFSKNNFKLTINNVVYKNDQLVEYYLGLIRTALKTYMPDKVSEGIKGYKAVSTSPVEYSEVTQLHYANVTIAVKYYNVGC